MRKPKIGDTRLRSCRRSRHPDLRSSASRPPVPATGRRPPSRRRASASGAGRWPRPCRCTRRVGHGGVGERSGVRPGRDQRKRRRGGRTKPASRHGRRRPVRATSGPRAQRPPDRALLHVRPGATRHGAGRGARGAQPDRALRQPPGRRRQPDPRQHLPRPGAERAAGHGGRLRRHRHPQERRALPG